jgi:hypothetical protein
MAEAILMGPRLKWSKSSRSPGGTVDELLHET